MAECETRHLFNYIQGSDITGESSFDIYRKLYQPTGTEDEMYSQFLEFIKSGPKGEQGKTGETGLSAYKEWTTLKGNENKTFLEFLEYLKGKQGKSAYEVWLDTGHVGTEEDFFIYLKGAKGEPPTFTEQDVIDILTNAGLLMTYVDADGSVFADKDSILLF